MDKEKLIHRFRLGIKMALLGCQHPEEKFVDTNRLNKDLLEILELARNAGLENEEWSQLLTELNPEVYILIHNDIKIAA
jgi:hypothetical protein